ncbi:MAG: zinc ribbon domain-containing protein [Candidatus Brocadiaceae bacterium]|nr:zinc ribbon domain-containing protein [Candidatus Brocadiaceae bacterium]
MPLVEYRCEDCGHVTEILVRVSEDQAPPCPECGSARTRRLISSFAARVAPGKPVGRCETCPHDSCPMR